MRSDRGDAGPGEEGELMVAGPTEMQGYWGAEPLRERAYAGTETVKAAFSVLRTLGFTESEARATST